jgi:AraC-like DNA-binding protein
VGQLIYASQGVMRVTVEDNYWIVPPERAVWAPPGCRHEIVAAGAFSMRTLYLSHTLSGHFVNECRAVSVSSLLRELILHIVQIGMLDSRVATHRRLTGVLLDLLRTAEFPPLSIRMPQDRRARVVAERLRHHPSERADLSELASAAGASTRTLQRAFLSETGLRFTQWRQRLRLLHAVSLLGTGASVTAAGLEAGYASTSAFVAAFRKQLGHTPAAYRFECGSSADGISTDP